MPVDVPELLSFSRYSGAAFAFGALGAQRVRDYGCTSNAPRVRHYAASFSSKWTASTAETDNRVHAPTGDDVAYATDIEKAQISFQAIRVLLTLADTRDEAFGPNHRLADYAHYPAHLAFEAIRVLFTESDEHISEVAGPVFPDEFRAKALAFFRCRAFSALGAIFLGDGGTIEITTIESRCAGWLIDALVDSQMIADAAASTVTTGATSPCRPTSPALATAFTAPDQRHHAQRADT